MAKLDENRNTDVAGSIAGYYYQILLACKEISRYDVIQEVGVETGADVNVISKSKTVMNIEAKLHKDNFSRYAADIVKTIYNFYTAYDENIKSFVFSTNSSPTKECKDFFDNWGSNGEEESYIKKCILLKSVEGPCKENYKKFCENTVIQERMKKENKKEIDLLLEETLDGTGEFLYNDYAVVSNLITYEKFAKLLKFSFAGKKKREVVSEIRNEIKVNIETTLEQIGKEKLESDEYDLIIDKMIDYFLEIILLNSEDSSPKIKFKSSDYIRILENYKTLEYNHISKYKIFSCIKEMQEEEEDVIAEIDACTSGGYKDKLKENYISVQSMVLDMIAYKYNEFAEAYQLKSRTDNGLSSVLVKLTYVLSIIMTKECLSLKDVKLVLDGGVNNIQLKDFLQCVYKKSLSNAYRHMKKIIAELICKYQEEALIDENQIFVVDADYKNCGRPCEVNGLEPEVYNITETEENYKYYLLFCHLNYKCTTCLDIDDEDGYHRFKCGGGNLCRKI